MAYPTSVTTFATRSAGQAIASAHINTLQTEVNALEAALLSTGLAHHLLFVDATYDIGASGATRPRDLFLSRNATVGGTLAVTGVSTLSGNLLFSADATHDVGASGATRPRDLFLSRNATIGGTLTVTGVATLSASTIGLRGVTYTLPSADASVSGYALTSNAAGTLSWAAAGTNITDTVIFTADGIVRRNTSDGSDNGAVSVTGGGATGTSRGGELFVYGNEHATPGSLIARIGNVASSKFAVNRADGTESFQILGSTGVATFVETVKLKGTTSSTAQVSLDMASNTQLTLTNNSTTTFSMTTGLIYIYDGTSGEDALFAVGNSTSRIINQKGAAWATTSTASTTSVEAGAGTITIRNRTGASASYSAIVTRLQ